MLRSRRSPRQVRLQQLLITACTAAGLTQMELAQMLRQPQSFVSRYETGERRLDLVELIELTSLLGCDLRKIVGKLPDARSVQTLHPLTCLKVQVFTGALKRRL
jgi:transcriptional regulator with XRE-family HTH domain